MVGLGAVDNAMVGDISHRSSRCAAAALHHRPRRCQNVRYSFFTCMLLYAHNKPNSAVTEKPRDALSYLEMLLRIKSHENLTQCHVVLRD